MYFRFDIVVAVGANDVDIMPEVAQRAIRDFGQGVVQLAIGVGEFLDVYKRQAYAMSTTAKRQCVIAWHVMNVIGQE